MAFGKKLIGNIIHSNFFYPIVNGGCPVFFFCQLSPLEKPGIGGSDLFIVQIPVIELTALEGGKVRIQTKSRTY
jgi:hypothetical protein